MMAEACIQRADPELYEILCGEETRQRETLDMIASESIQDEVSLALSGSAFCSKTAVGNVGKQRLGGSEYADALEKLAAERACRVFGAEHANMLSYSGTVANLCVYDALLSPHDSVLALDPEMGSHASHGRKEHISARFYDFHHFGVDPETQTFDFDALERHLETDCPRLVVIGSSSYPRAFDFERIARTVHAHGAWLMVDMAHFSGLVAAGLAENPVKYADVVTASATKTMCGCHTGYILCRKELAERIDRGVYPGVVASMHLQTVAAAAWVMKKSQTAEFRETMRKTLENARDLAAFLQERGFGILTGGTDCHMFVADLRPLGKNGVELTETLEQIGISVNTKGIPWDTSKVPNGIRAGCTVLTQRDFGRAEMETIADLFADCVNPTEAKLAHAKETVSRLCANARNN